MPRQHGAEMPNDCQPFVVIDVVKSSAMNKPEKRPGWAHIKKSYFMQCPQIPKFYLGNLETHTPLDDFH